MSRSTTNIKDDAKRPELVLVVDDDQTILESVSDLLTQGGYETLTANDGLQALQVLQARTPDLIISDVMMPDIDGFEFYNRVRLNPAWMLVPFIFLTARGQATDIRQGIGLGADAYLTKPFTREDLLVAVQSRLQRMQQIEHAAQGRLERLQHTLLTMFNHELRTPLTYIFGCVGLLEDHAAMEPAEIDEMLAGIRIGADRLLRLVEDSLLIARIDTGELKAEVAHYREPVELASLAQEVAQAKTSIAEQHQVRIEVEVPDEIIVSGMPSHLQNALARLVDNAIKFSAPGGGHVLIRAEIEANQCLIGVQDDGIGIHPDQQRLLFERFRQIDREHLEQQGIGLGLTIVQGIIEAHGGRVSVSSVGIPGQGSIFTVTLPVQA